jgi:hypothetical protein
LTRRRHSEPGGGQEYEAVGALLFVTGTKRAKDPRKDEGLPFGSRLGDADVSTPLNTA